MSTSSNQYQDVNEQMNEADCPATAGACMLNSELEPGSCSCCSMCIRDGIFEDKALKDAAISYVSESGASAII